LLRDIEDTLASDDELLPPNFTKVWRSIERMRASRDAPVDTSGTQMLGDRSQPIAVWRFQTLTACMLSSQTKDEATAACMERLKRFGLTVENILSTPDELLKGLLYGVGFHNTKTKHLKQICQILKDKYDSDIPGTYEELIKLTGIGPKMANIIMSVARGEITGMAVDIHVHRISNRLGWVRTKSPEATRIALQRFVPRSLWSETNLLLVGFGQQVCHAVHPKCLTCLANSWCPVGQKQKLAVNKSSSKWLQEIDSLQYEATEPPD